MASSLSIIEQSKGWRFPAGTPPGDYSLIFAVDPETRDVQVGFAVADVESMGRTIERRYRLGVRRCYQKLLGIKPEAGGARRFCEALQSKGILAKETHENVIRFAPPLVIDKETIDWALPSIREVLNMA